MCLRGLSRERQAPILAAFLVAFAPINARVGSCTPGRFWFWTNHSLSALTLRASLRGAQAFGCHFLFFASYQERWNFPPRSSLRYNVPSAFSFGIETGRSVHFS